MPGCDIQPVETLTWSWRAGLREGAIGAIGAIGCAPLVIFALMLALGSNSKWAIGCLLFSIVPGLLLGAVAGLTTGVKDMKTVPNQGIRLSMRCAIYGGLVVGMTASTVLGMTASTVLGFFSAWDTAWAGLFVGLVFGLAVALIAGTWLGGLDVILHYFLRLLLYVKGRTPLNLVRFLDYTAKDLNFLQKVGGSYIFIHGMLLEHFAAMQTEGKSNPQETPALIATTPFEAVSPIR